jgi:DMSO/TMAO reductase YedYZ molybdopterin-dependent catalytic subunit
MDNRRQFIKYVLGATAFLSATANPVISFLKRAFADVQRRILSADTRRESLINENPKNLDAGALPLTPLEGFGTMGTTQYQVNLNEWRLSVSGSVENPVSLAYEALITLPSIEKKVLMICPGFFANQGIWTGVSMKSLLETVKPSRAATRVVFIGHNITGTQEESFPMNEVVSGSVFLAYKVNGEVLPERHGYPLRVVAVDHYGSDWVKYVNEMRVME